MRTGAGVVWMLNVKSRVAVQTVPLVFLSMSKPSLPRHVCLYLMLFKSSVTMRLTDYTRTDSEGLQATDYSVHAEPHNHIRTTVSLKGTMQRIFRSPGTHTNNHWSPTKYTAVNNNHSSSAFLNWQSNFSVRKMVIVVFLPSFLSATGKKTISEWICDLKNNNNN